MMSRMESRVRIQALGDELRSLSIIIKKGLKDCEVGERPFWRMTIILLVKRQNKTNKKTHLEIKEISLLGKPI